MKPRILLSANTDMQFYVDAVEFCGGIADIKYCPEFSDAYDGLILCGGNDIDPAYYGEDINGAVNIDARRDTAEFALAKAFVSAKKPIFGICRGAQLLNAVFGGTLYQHIKNAAQHGKIEGEFGVHTVKAYGDSLIGKLYGEDFAVNTAHHQAVKVLGNGLKATMHAGDTVEGFEHQILPILGVQWHPERMCLSQRRDNMADGIKLFRYFVQLCRK